MSDENDAGLPYDQTHVGQLPVEVLRAIFHLDADVSHVDEHRPRVQDCWMRLSHVCSVFRAVLLDMPALWAQDVLAFGVQRKCFADILARAQDVPLDLNLGNTDEAGFRAISSFIARARLLKFVWDSSSDPYAILDCMSDASLPSLRILDINLGMHNWPGQQNKNIPILERAINLRCLKLTDMFFRLHVAESLVELDIRFSYTPRRKPTVDDFLHALSHNPGLRTLVLHSAFDESRKVERSTAVVLPALRSCSISNWSERNLHIFVGFIRMPDVREVVLTDNRDFDTDDTAELDSALVDAALRACAGAPVLTHNTFLVRHTDFYLSVTLRPCADRPHEGFKLLMRGSEQQAAKVDVIVDRLSDAGILLRTRELHIDVVDVDAGAGARWNIIVIRCAEVQKLHLYLDSDHAEPILELIRHTREAGGFSSLSSITITLNHWEADNAAASRMRDCLSGGRGGPLTLEVHDGVGEHDKSWTWSIGEA